MLIVWKDEYLVGHSVIDLDHQTLVAITNDLYDSVQNGSGQEQINITIQRLLDYIERHFAREEDIFIDSDYPDARAHMQKHREIEKVVTDLAAAYKGDPTAISIDEVTDFLKRWLTNHIARTDRTYIPFL